MKGYVLALFAVVSAGCAAPGSVGQYFGSRGRDLADCFKISAGFGPGVCVVAEIPLCKFGVGFKKCSKIGWDGRGGAPGYAWRETGRHRFKVGGSGDDNLAGELLLGLPLEWARYELFGPAPAWAWWVAGSLVGLVVTLSYEEELESAGAGAGTGADTEGSAPERFHFKHRFIVSRKAQYGRPVSAGTRLADRFWVGGDVTIAVLSAGAGVNPLECVDFFLGIFCIDPLRDDRAVGHVERPGTL